MPVASETPAQRAGRQLKALMNRHNVKNANVLHKMMKARGDGSAVDPVTIRRILKADATTEPEKHTLRKLAVFLHETYESAFPEPTYEAAPTIEVNGQRLLLATPDGSPISPSLVQDIQRALAESKSSPRK